MKKSREEILQDLEYRLKLMTDITNSDPGSIARTFLEVLTEEFFDFYDQLDLAVTMGFVSTASGRYLDMIGMLLDCQRQASETDDNYRARIVNQVYVVAGANLTAIRLRGLSVDGVKDLVFKEYSHGAGSFSCYVITDDAQASQSILNAVEAAINDTKAYGIYGEVKTPVLIPVQLMVRLIFSSDTGTIEKTTIRSNAVNAVRDYINSLLLGDTLIINEVIERIMDVSEKIQDIDVYGMSVNGTSRYVTNASIKWDERFVLDMLDIT